MTYQSEDGGEDSNVGLPRDQNQPLVQCTNAIDNVDLPNALTK